MPGAEDVFDGDPDSIDTTPTRAYELPTKIEHPLAHAWKKAMGSNNPRLPAVREILFGEGASE